ncbi:MAG: transglutaminase family protein [Acetobacteraceae bacterium]|nr:transglutaminase family protein [Acetobacteraceae bacterium]
MSASSPSSGDPRAALDAIGHLPDPEIDIADAALHLARVDAPAADWQAARVELTAIARDAVELARAVKSDATLPVLGEALSGLLVGRHGFRGDPDTYDDLDNANLIRVIERRKGLPVALGILWLHAARAAGWGAHGVDFPAHFLLALEGRGGQLILDVFDGGTPLDARQLRALLKRIEGERAELRPGLLRPMDVRAVLLRLQNNIKARRLGLGDLAGAVTCVEDMLRIAPDHAGLWREAGLMHQRLGHVQAALQCLQHFLDLAPQGESAARARAAIEELRTRLN